MPTNTTNNTATNDTVPAKDNARATNNATSCNTTPNPGWVYSDIVKEHFLNPRNFLMGDEAKYPRDAEGIVGNPICGDQMKMFLQVEDGKIKDVKWKTYGCASAIASTSALSELAKGKALEDALKIGPAEIAEFLGGLPAHKFHCSVLGHEALASAIADYRARH